MQQYRAIWMKRQLKSNLLVYWPKHLLFFIREHDCQFEGRSDTRDAYLAESKDVQFALEY